jgi:predicted  nucleic acid-binding Zn-ribbon protein
MILLIDVKYSVPHQQDDLMTKTTIMTNTKTPKTTVNGANELKKTIQEYVAMTDAMKTRFDNDIHLTGYGSTHREFIRKLARESDEIRTPETNVNVTLATLEKLRKMLVTNKQQRKTAHKHFRRIANAIQASFQSNTMSELEPKPVSLAVDLMNMDANAKQHHRTIARNILEQVNRLLAEMRQFIVALQVALDDAVGKIIQYACRAFGPENEPEPQQMLWNEGFNIADGRAAAVAIQLMDEFDDADDDMCWE